jgi:hypothetical protein
MSQHHSTIVTQPVGWVSEPLIHSGRYGVVSRLSRTIGVSRQALSSWKAKGQAALQEALVPVKEGSASGGMLLERAILTRLFEGHARYPGSQRCLRKLLGLHVSLGKIAAVAKAGRRASSAVDEPSSADHSAGTGLGRDVWQPAWPSLPKLGRRVLWHSLC